MVDDLTRWEALLAAHFRELSVRRSNESQSQHVFALEHGLDKAQVEAMACALRVHVAKWPPLRTHLLVWIVYAAEIGYHYAGDEYWQTFEQETPGWSVWGSRDWIRDCYRTFQRNYNGAVPTGPWAEHFSIICWPITHAILPRDLQRQLARILYELRHSFSADLLQSTSALGEHIAARSWNATSRFQNLAQDTELIGQIAAALLLHSESGNDTLIYPATLRRIGEDLEHERQARDWLRGARRFAQERVTIRGLTLRRGTMPNIVGHPEAARAEVTALGIEPRLVLRPTDSALASWEVFLEIPDLSHLLIRFPRTREILTGSRCVVAGATGAPLARGRCLHAAQRVRLDRWPGPHEVLLRFEQSDIQLDYLLRTECLLRPGPIWLFRVASDGLAYESRGLRVRPRERYVLVKTDEIPDCGDHLQTAELLCAGAHAAMFSLPEGITTGWEDTLRRLRLRQARSLEVWPSGLAAVVWDGEGHVEWLASERPCLGIRTDHDVDAIIVSMATAHSLELAPLASGESQFIELPQLPVGLHTVRVSTRTKPYAQAEPLGELDVLIRIREARPWSVSGNSQGPMRVQVEPPTPSLEQVWEGHATLSLSGPNSRQAKCRISLFDKNPDSPIFVHQLPPLSLPVPPEIWRKHFDKHFRAKPAAQEAYDAARLCAVEFEAGELGTFVIRCERLLTPLRWAIRRNRQGYVVRLLDDTGVGNQPTVSRIAFETPFMEEELSLAEEYSAPVAGGLYVARINALTATVIVSPTVTELGDLSCVPSIQNQTRTPDAVIRAMKFARLWASARLSGDVFSKTRQEAVLYAILHHMFALIGGDNWARAEVIARDSGDGLARLKDAVSRRHQEAALAIVLDRDYPVLTSVTCDDRAKRLASLATKFLAMPASDETVWLAEFAIRLASDPMAADEWAGQSIRDAISRLMEVPTLARAARFLVLACDRHQRASVATGELYAGWVWK